MERGRLSNDGNPVDVLRRCVSYYVASRVPIIIARTLTLRACRRVRRPWFDELTTSGIYNADYRC